MCHIIVVRWSKVQVIRVSPLSHQTYQKADIRRVGTDVIGVVKSIEAHTQFPNMLMMPSFFQFSELNILLPVTGS